MKNLIPVVLVVLLGTTTYLMAQQGPNMFNSRQECENAFLAGKFSYYHPKFFNHYRDNPVDGVKKITAPLTRDAVVEMITANGKKFVVLPEGEILRWEISCSQGKGLMRMNPYADDTCGNKIFSVSYPSRTEEVTERVPPLSSYFQIPGPKGDQGPRGRAGRDRIVEVKSISYTPYVVGGVLIVGIVWVAENSKNHNDTYETPPGVTTTPAGPGVTTGPAGPGITTGGATRMTTPRLSKSKSICVGFRISL